MRKLIVLGMLAVGLVAVACSDSPTTVAIEDQPTLLAQQGSMEACERFASYIRFDDWFYDGGIYTEYHGGYYYTDKYWRWNCVRKADNVIVGGCRGTQTWDFSGNHYVPEDILTPGYFHCTPSSNS
jgi:hypothetical protein